MNHPPVGESFGMTRRRRAWVTAGIMLGIFLGALEATAVVTAMPTAVSSLGGLELYSWVYSIYFLATTVTAPLWGRLSDLYGRRNFYLAGIALFVLGSMACGASASMTQLIFFRAVQGIGAGALLPLGQTIVGDIYSLERRAKMQGLFSGVWGLSSMIGPLAGGLIADYLSWRWVFFLNLPFGLASAACIALALTDPGISRRRKIDYRGALFLVAALSLLLLALDRWVSEAGNLVYGLGASSLGCWALFLAVERNASDPVLPLQLFRDRIFSAAAANGFFSGMALFGAISFIPLFVQGVLGTQAVQAGWALTPLTLSWVIFSILSGRLLLRVGYRRTVVSGMLCLVLGFLLLTRVGPATPFSSLAGMMVLIGMGMGLSMIPMLIAVQNRFPRTYLGIATSSTQFFRTLGASVGIAIMGSVMVSGMLQGLSGLHLDLPPEEVSRIAHHPEMIVNPEMRRELPGEVLRAAQGILAGALKNVFLTGFWISLLALLAAFWIPSGSAQEHARRR